MTYQIGLLLALIVVALVLFSVDWVGADVVGMGVLIALLTTGLLPADRVFAGFGSDTVIMILSLLIMTAALTRTGMVDLAGQTILRHAGTRPEVVLFTVLAGAGALSAFISNTAATAFFLPVVISVASRAKFPAYQLLLPLAFASILTSSVTLVSTSTNLVVSGLMTTAGLPRLRMFELAPVGIPIALVGILYMYFIGRRLIPRRAPGEGLIDEYEVRSFLTEALILPGSKLVSKTLGESKLGSELDLNVVRLIRADEPDRSLLPLSHLVLRAGDTLIVEGAREEVLKIKDTAGLEIKPEVSLADPFLKAEDAALVEALIVPGSLLVGRTLRGLNFRTGYGLQVLGINRHGRNIVQKLSRILLSVGDVSG